MRPSVPKLFSTVTSLSTVQVLSAIICLSCVVYLTLSTFQPQSLERILTGFKSASWQTIAGINNNFNVLSSNPNITTTTTHTKLNFSTEASSKNQIHSMKNESYICDHIGKNNTNKTTNVSSFENHRYNTLRPYCNILPTPRNRWSAPQKYVESDIVFVIYTGAPFYQTRAMATRDTWLSRVTHKYFFSSIPYPSLPITVVEGTGENYLSNMEKLHLGMKIAYEKHNQTAKFYFLAGCDTFVNVPHLLKRLDNFDHEKPLVIGGHPFGYSCFVKKNVSAGGVTYPSGGAGFFFSSGLMNLMYPKLTPFFRDDWPSEKVPYSDVALNCLAKSIGAGIELVPGFWPSSPEAMLKLYGHEKLTEDPEPNTFHYISPTSMYVLDEFYVFQHIDRLANDRNLDELVKFTRQFVAVHYELLRVKKSECTLPPVKTK